MNSLQVINYKKNINLDYPSIRNKILTYLNNNRVDNRTKHENIYSINDLNTITSNDYIICPRFSGVRSWIIFCVINDVYYAVNFPKQNCNKNNQLRMYPIELGVTKDFYCGTIMEGIFYKVNNQKIIVVDEIYVLSGKNQLAKSKDDRLTLVSKCIQKSVRSNCNFNIYVSQFFETSENSLSELYDKIKNDRKIRQIIFYPKTFGQKIFSYTIIDNDLVDNVVSITKFIMQKTASSDVYHLIDIDSGKKVDGIAYIPDISTSKQCRRWFKDYNKKELIVKCQLDNLKKKWIPIELLETDVDNLSD